MVGISRIARVKKKEMSNRIVRSSTPTKKKVTMASVNIASHRLEDTSGNLMQVETSKNTQQVRQSKMLIKGILALRRRLPSEKKSIRFSRQSLEKAQIRDNFPSSTGEKQRLGKSHQPAMKQIL